MENVITTRLTVVLSTSGSLLGQHPGWTPPRPEDYPGHDSLRFQYVEETQTVASEGTIDFKILNS